MPDSKQRKDSIPRSDLVGSSHPGALSQTRPLFYLQSDKPTGALSTEAQLIAPTTSLSEQT